MLVGLNGCETQHFLFVTVGTGFPISTQFAAEYPPPKKTEDYVDSVCVAIYGFNLMAMMFGVARLPNSYCGDRKIVI